MCPRIASPGKVSLSWEVEEREGERCARVVRALCDFLRPSPPAGGVAATLGGKLAAKLRSLRGTES